MHELGMVLIAVSNGHLYRNCRGIRKIEHYVLMPDDGEICKNFSSSLQESFTFTKARALIHANTNRVPTYTSTLDGITTLPYWYTSVIMPEEGITDRACVLFSINLDTNRGHVSRRVAHSIRCAREDILHKAITNTGESEISSGLALVNAIECHNDIVRSHNLTRVPSIDKRTFTYSTVPCKMRGPSERSLKAMAFDSFLPDL